MSDTGSKARHETLRERLAFFGFARTKVFASPIENWELGAQMVTLATNPGTSDYAAYCDRVEQTLAPFERAYHLGLREQQGFDDGFGHGASAMKRAAREAVEATARAGSGPAVPAREWVHTRSAVTAIDASSARADMGAEAGRNHVTRDVSLAAAYDGVDGEELELSAGDEVEVTTSAGAVVRAAWCVSPGGTGFLGLDGDSGRCVTLRGSDRVRVVRKAGLDCPFPVFSIVREAATGVEFKVVGWRQVDGEWVAEAEHGTAGRHFPLSGLELAEDPWAGMSAREGSDWLSRRSLSDRYEPTVDGSAALRESPARPGRHGAGPAERPVRG